MHISVLKGALMDMRCQTSMIEHTHFVDDYPAKFVMQEGYAATMIRHFKAVLPKWSYDPEYNRNLSNRIKARLQAGLHCRFKRLTQQTAKAFLFKLLMDKLAPETATEAPTTTNTPAPTTATQDKATTMGSTNTP